MSSNRRVTDDCRYVVTLRGHHDLETAETCVCRPRIEGLMLICPLCGTLYGHLSESVGNLRGVAEYKRR